MLRKAILAALGAMTLTKEKSREFVDQLVKRGEIAKDEAPEFLKQLIKRGDETRVELDKRIGVAVERFSKRMDFATRTDIQQLRRELQKLSRRLDKISKR